MEKYVAHLQVLKGSSAVERQVFSMDGLDVENWQFAQFQFICGQDLLVDTQSGEQHKLEPQVSRLLLLFCQSQGHLLTRESLEKSLWPSTIVDNNSLYQLLTKLRRLLNDSPRQPVFIKTIPKRGYRFLPNATLMDARIAPVITALPRSSSFSWAKWLGWGAVSVAGFAAVASLGSRYDAPPPVQYELTDVSYALGLEAEVSAHRSQDLIAYVKDINQLQVTDKSGNLLQSRQVDTRVSLPQWHPERSLLAYWQYQQGQCLLNLSDDKLDSIHVSRPLPCTYAKRPVWNSQDELVVILKRNHQNLPYLYRVSTGQLILLPLDLEADETIRGAVRAWDDEIFYLINRLGQGSRLVSLAGKTMMEWDHPVWLLSYNPKRETLIINHPSQIGGVLEQALGHEPVVVANTAQGVFTSVSADQHGQLFVASESWQVNIRNKLNMPLFSSSSIDYLPATNPLGETAFMSRRSGVCEVYLQAGSKLTRLSQYSGNAYADFLQWSPDNSALLSNRDKQIVLYGRQGEIAEFSAKLSGPLLSLSWVDEERLYAFDGNNLSLYNRQGVILQQWAIEALAVHYDWHEKRWLVFTPSALQSKKSLDEAGEQITRLDGQHTNQLINIKLVNGRLYWQSKWDNGIQIWQLALNEQSTPSLITSGHFIWHFDVDPTGELMVAARERVEGDIKVLRPVPH
ncbi:winged helix-turn-helix domain-containing protein [Bowmanella yangjiangensis]|uniref:Winged helix-turn-helix domain-containing protein n=1 Tax=Bowmanella yangjiangensis TaxID=2811230 RepID=A0ABS3CW78_9ALTE|nr:winged helix-turn-helix domain-containing protein [Bowmanella yangjiangensis]MBN7821376.1 winged helix-turn-helix domain-containing protein [Bowmanella yangjiangensis]